MKIQQISVFVENQPGRLVAMLKALDQGKVNIKALSISDTADFGIVRLVVSDATAGSASLRQAGFTTRLDWILAAEVEDYPGALLRNVAEPLAREGVNLKYFYAFFEPSLNGRALVVLKPDNMEKAEKVLESQAGKKA